MVANMARSGRYRGVAWCNCGFFLLPETTCKALVSEGVVPPLIGLTRVEEPEEVHAIVL